MSERTPTAHPATPRPTTVAEVQGLAVIPLTHATEPNAAGLLGIGRRQAYEFAASGALPTLRPGHRYLVPVPALLRMLGGDKR